MSDDPNRIRLLRLERNWSQQRLADIVGVSKVTISDLERGKMALTLEYMRRIAAALSEAPGHDVGPGDLMLARDNPNVIQDEAERKLIEAFRKANAVQREMIERLAEPPSREEAA